MKKSLVLVAAAAALSISTSASALVPSGVQGRTVSSTLGTLGVVSGVMAPGATTQGFFAGQACNYILQIRDAYNNPNNKVLCRVVELQDALDHSSCTVNRTEFFNTQILAGPQIGASCSMYDLLGEPVSDVQLILKEMDDESISGLYFQPYFGWLPLSIG